nr:MAG TPA: Lysozyme [Caudoviricetes sp.]
MNTTERNMAAAILRFEDSRVTGPDSLRVSRLPAADKGGKWEICGICDGIEPAVFNRLKALLDAGKREEAWEGCLQYILDNTAAVRTWIGSDAHPATEFILRDHYFNSGSRNTGKILQRTLNIHGAGLAVDGIVGPKTRQELQVQIADKNEALFIIGLQEKRKAFYRSCKQFPTFGKGWLNRCDDAYQFALSLI